MSPAEGGGDGGGAQSERRRGRAKPAIRSQPECSRGSPRDPEDGHISKLVFGLQGRAFKRTGSVSGVKSSFVFLTAKRLSYGLCLWDPWAGRLARRPPHQAQKSELRVKRAWCLTEAPPRPAVHLSSSPANLDPIFWGVSQGLGLVIPLALASGTINWDG